MMFGRLPSRPVPMGRRRSGPRPSGRGRRASGSPLGYRPLFLVFRRPTTAPAPRGTPVADRAPIQLSVHFAVTLESAERLKEIVEQAASLVVPQLALRLLARIPPAAVGRAAPTVASPAGTLTPRFAAVRQGSAASLPVRASSRRPVLPIGRRHGLPFRVIEGRLPTAGGGSAGGADRRPRRGPTLSAPPSAPDRLPAAPAVGASSAIPGPRRPMGVRSAGRLPRSAAPRQGFRASSRVVASIEQWHGWAVLATDRRGHQFAAAGSIRVVALDSTSIPAPGIGDPVEPTARLRPAATARRRPRVVGPALTLRPGSVPVGRQPVRSGGVIPSAPVSAGQQNSRFPRRRLGDPVAPWRWPAAPTGWAAASPQSHLTREVVNAPTGAREASVGRRGDLPPAPQRHLLGRTDSLLRAGVRPTWEGSPDRTSRGDVTEPVRHRVTQVHRMTPEARKAPGGPASDPAGNRRPAGPAAPAPQSVDLDRLDRDLWKRFEKRIRVEQERRGRS
jgi:hypothetical protein